MAKHYAHVKALEYLLGPSYPDIPIYSFVVFPLAGKLRITGTDSVGYVKDILKKVTSLQVKLLSTDNLNKIFEIINNANIQDKELRKSHNRDVKTLINSRN